MDGEHAAPVSPVSNLHLAPLLPLVHVKLRVGRARAHQAATQVAASGYVTWWQRTFQAKVHG